MLTYRIPSPIRLNSGFTITMYEYQPTIESLWSTVLGTAATRRSSLPTDHGNPRFSSLADFITEHPEHLAPNNAMNFISDNGGLSYNLCYCSSVLPSNSSKKI